MSSADDLLALADRCEREAGSRELDRDVVVALGWTPFEQYWMAYSPHYGEPATIPHYTTSLDAALTLVPDGFGWQGGDSYSAYGTNKWARVFPPNDMAKGTGNREARTIALALCAAALRARAAVSHQNQSAMRSEGEEG